MSFEATREFVMKWLHLAFCALMALVGPRCGGGGGDGAGAPPIVDALFTNRVQQANGRVWAMAPATDGSGDLYVGGRFTAYNSKGINRIVRLNTDGTVDAGFAVGTGFNGTVNTLAPATDGSGDCRKTAGVRALIQCISMFP
jgi:hypothetical protein